MKKIICIFICLIITVCLCACTDTEKTPGGETSESSLSSQPQKETYASSDTSLYEDIYIVSVDSYSGEFVEDGSGKTAETMSVTVSNNGESDYELFEFALDFDGEERFFSIKTLPAHSELTVLESEGKKLPSGEEYSARVTDAVRFESPISLHAESIEIMTAPGVINVHNITGNDLENVYVYYKAVTSDGRWLGGITHRVPFGTVGAGEIVQRIIDGFDNENCRMVFVTYD